MHSESLESNSVTGFLSTSALHRLLEVRSIHNQVSQNQSRSGLWLLPNIYPASDTSLWNVAAYKASAVNTTSLSPEIQKWNCTRYNNSESQGYTCKLLSQSQLNKLIPYPMFPNVYHTNVSIPFQEGDILGIYQPLPTKTDTQLYFFIPESKINPCIHKRTPAADDQYKSAVTSFSSFNVSLHDSECPKWLPLVNSDALQGNQ